MGVFFVAFGIKCSGDPLERVAGPDNAKTLETDLVTKTDRPDRRQATGACYPYAEGRYRT